VVCSGRNRPQSSKDQCEAAPGVVPVVRDDAFFANATGAAGSSFDVILDSVGGAVLAEAADHPAVGGRLVTYGAAAGQADPDTPAYGALRASNHTISGFSILKLARPAPERVRSLITDVLSLTGEGLAVTPPTVIQWDQLVDAHVRQSEGRALGKSVVAVSRG
jgi:NADPH:quinone reductase